jgi:hypothetical protein
VLLGVGLAAPAEPVEHEHADLLLAVLTDPIGREVPNSFEREAIEAARNMEWTGTPNRLSQEHVDWEIIEQTAELSRKPRTEPGTRMVEAVDRAGARARPPRNVSAGTLFRQRRSAVAMDGSTSIPREAFYRMLQSTLPSAAAPFDVWPYEPRIHFGLFVHRVDDLAAGLYAFVRSPDRVDEFRNAMRPDLAWTAPEGCPESLPLYALADLDCRTLAAQVSCLQDIAGDGAFSLGMIADFDRPLREHGPWYYPRLYWEAGLVGQVLYLEAEAAGVRSTGIGCYFDDAVHDVFGLRGHAFQSLYHFTVGGAVDDPRITGLPPYSAERRARQGWV